MVIPQDVNEIIKKYPFIELVDRLSYPFHKKIPIRWDEWSYFIEELPIIINIDSNTSYEFWFKKGSNKPLLVRRVMEELEN